MTAPLVGLLAALLTSPAVAEAASVSEAEPAIAASERIYIDTSVRLPLFMWFLSDFNREVRTSGFDIELVMTCKSERVTRRAHETRCRIDDASLQGIPMPSERGRLGPVVEEMREKMVGAELIMQVRNDGKIRNINLREAFRDGRRHRRIRLMNENLRLVLQRAVAGLDLQAPREPLQPGMTWGQGDTLLTGAPVTVGTLGSTSLVHQSREEEPGFVTVRTEGKAMIAPAGPLGGTPTNFFDTRVVVESVHHADSGLLSARAWTVVGQPTSSSALAEGFAGIPYVQNGRLVALKDNEVPELRESGERESDSKQPSALQVQSSEGLDSGRSSEW